TLVSALYAAATGLFYAGHADHRDLHSSLHDALPISCRKRENSGANRRVSPCDRRIWYSFWKALVHEKMDIAARMTTMDFANKPRSEEHTSELQSLRHLVCRLLLEKKNKTRYQNR